MPRSGRRGCALALLAGWLAFGAPFAAGAAGAVAAGPAPVDFRFEDARITESSGLALSVRHPHTVWTVNDSGDSARVFAVDTRTGKTVGVHTFDAPVRDIEALAITPQGRMLVADIGDNGRDRTVVRVFWFDEPRLGKTSGDWASWELSYPDGPHNAEALAVDPTSGRVFIVTKERPGGIYALPAAPSRKGVNTLTRVGAAPDIATDAVFLPGGAGLAVRTYTSLVVVDPTTWRERSSQVLPLQPQGETIARAPDGTGLIVGSEGRSSRVQQVTITPASAPSPNVPSQSTTSGLATASDPTTAASSPVAGATSTLSVADPRANRGSDFGPPVVNRGELVAGLGACAGLVLLAYLIARLSRPRRR